MKTVLDKIWNFLMAISETRAAAAMARAKKYDLAKHIISGI